MIAKTVTRVEENTAPHINERIRRQTESRLQCYASASRVEIERRLDELDREWDIERSIEANASSLTLVGLLLGRFVHRRFYALPAVVAAFLLQHSVQGWCPPVPILRRWGVRTAHEIEQERRALEALL